MLEVLYIFQRCWILVIFCQIFVKVKKLHKIRSKVDKNCASDWADIFKTPVFYSACSKVLLSLRKYLMALKHPYISYVPTLLYVRFISAADKASGGVRKRVRKRDMYVYPEISHVCENFFTLQTCENVG